MWMSQSCEAFNSATESELMREKVESTRRDLWMFNYSRWSEAGRLGSAGIKVHFSSLAWKASGVPKLSNLIFSQIFFFLFVSSTRWEKQRLFCFICIWYLWGPEGAQDRSRRGEPAHHSVGLHSAVHRILLESWWKRSLHDFWVTRPPLPRAADSNTHLWLAEKICWKWIGLLGC